MLAISNVKTVTIEPKRIFIFAEINFCFIA
jgi:hypothetical protein